MQEKFLCAFFQFKIVRECQSKGGVHKLRLQDEVGRWSKNVRFLSTFTSQKMSTQRGQVVIKAKIWSTQFVNSPITYIVKSSLPPLNTWIIFKSVLTPGGLRSKYLASILFFKGSTLNASPQIQILDSAYFSWYLQILLQMNTTLCIRNNHHLLHSASLLLYVSKYVLLQSKSYFLSHFVNRISQ